MSVKHLITTLLLSSSLFMPSNALAQSDLTPEQLAKARETASQMNPPVDFDAMLEEADRLGVECTGDLSRKVRIKICAGNVEIAQSKEWVKASKERQAKLDEKIEASKKRQAKLDEEAIQMVNDLSDRAEQKLKQTQ